jgi:hypothetical protein
MTLMHAFCNALAIVSGGDFTEGITKSGGRFRRSLDETLTPATRCVYLLTFGVGSALPALSAAG